MSELPDHSWQLFWASLTGWDKFFYDATCNCVSCEKIRERYEQFKAEYLKAITPLPTPPDGKE